MTSIKSNRMSNKPSLIRVASDSSVHKVAGAIAGMIRERDKAEMRAVGAAAINQAVKALAVARAFLSEDGIEIAYTNDFEEIAIKGAERTAITFRVFVLNS